MLALALAGCGSSADRGLLGRAPHIPDAHLTIVEGVVVAKDSNGSLELGACLPGGNTTLSAPALKATHLSAIESTRSADSARCSTTLPAESSSGSRDGPPASLAQAAVIGDIIVRVETVGMGNMTTSYAWQDAGGVLPQ